MLQLIPDSVGRIDYRVATGAAMPIACWPSSTALTVEAHVPAESLPVEAAQNMYGLYR